VLYNTCPKDEATLGLPLHQVRVPAAWLRRSY
jgi:hypothetical protein